MAAAVDVEDGDAVLGTQGTYLDHLDTVGGLRAWRDLLVGHQRKLECRGGCPLGTLGVELAEIDDVARMAVARRFGRWEARIRDGLRAMHDRGDLPAGADPDDLALATLAALQGGLLLAQVQRDPRPLEVAACPGPPSTPPVRPPCAPSPAPGRPSSPGAASGSRCSAPGRSASPPFDGIRLGLTVGPTWALRHAIQAR